MTAQPPPNEPPNHSHHRRRLPDNTTTHHPPPNEPRGRGDRGSAVVAALVLLFVFTAGGVIWLSRDVNRVVTNRSAAQSIAFQAARAGAQQVDVGSLRGGGDPVVELNPGRALTEGQRIADELFAAYGVTGTSFLTINGDTVTARVTIFDADGETTASGSVQAQTGP